MNRLFSIIFCVCACSWSSVTPLLSQQPGGIREVINIKGALEGARGNILTVKSDDGKSYMVRLPEDIEAVRYKGSGVPTMLQPGLMIRFEGMFDPSTGRTTVPVSQLEVFNPMKPKHAQQKDIMEITPGIYPVDSGNAAAGAGAGLFADPNEKRPRTKAQPQSASFKVIGQVAGISKKGVNVNAGRMLQIEVLPTTQIAVSDYGLRFAQPGDPIQVDGFYFPPNETQVLAQRITVTGANPLGVPQEKPKPGKAVKNSEKEPEEKDAESKNAK